MLLTLGKHIRESIFAFAGAGFASFGDGSVAGIPWQMLLGALALLLVVVPTLAQYLTFRYRFDQEELVIRSGWLRRNERHVPFAKIQSIDAHEGVLHRMVGAVAVTLETGGGAEAEGKITAISRAAFHDMRDRVHAGRHAGPVASAADTPAPAESSTTLVRLTPRETMLAGLVLGRGMFVIGAIVALLFEYGLGEPIARWLFRDDAGNDGLLSSLFSRFEADEDHAGAVLMGAGLLAVFLLFVRGLASVMTTVRFYDHRLDLVGDDLRVSCGLIARSHSTTPIRRIQSLTVTEGPWHRLTGRVTLQVATAGGVEAKEQVASRETLAPFLRRGELDAIIAVALRGLRLPADGWAGAAAPAYRREAIEQAVLWTLPIAAGLYFWWPIALACAVLALVAIAAAMMRVSRFRWLAFDGGVALQTGWLWRRVTVARHDRVQLALFKESPFDRRHGMASVSVDTAGSQAPTISFDLLTRHDAARLVAQLDAGLATTEFTT